MAFAFQPTFSADFYVQGIYNNEPFSDIINITLYGNWSLLSLLGGDPGGGGPLGTNVNILKLMSCTQELYGVFADSFTSTVPTDADGKGGAFGSFHGTILRPGRNQARSFSVVNNPYTLTYNQSIQDCKDGGFPPGSLCVGHVDPSSPYTTFSMQGQGDAGAVETQIIELGNALNIIGGILTTQQLEASDHSTPVPGSGFLNSVAGIKLLDCLKKNGGIK